MQSNSRDKKFDRHLTISNAKNISLEVLLAGDNALQSAHHTAVIHTIDLIESRYAQTRINEQSVGTHNLAVAKLHHAPSRELEAHLYTHCVVSASGDEEC